jgi:hypothetical protein
VWQRWLASAGPWQGFGVCATLLSPNVEQIAPRSPRQRPSQAFIDRLASALARGCTMCVLDIDPGLGVQAAARLAPLAYPVLVMPRWPYPRAVLPVDCLIGALLEESRRLPAPAPTSNVVFVLDGQRSSVRARQDDRADNRHTLAVFEMPTLKTLRERGIQRVLVVR